eukprot:TRINITY_DN1829_c0_g1_i1.p1 TRINITY_DN1829_c0_g1~~TRINITY_DN1829_c0_g1_i1.p1  ORF type:complete len:199 (+),score=41.07 TRINITY_DN1829_c0_g1_i1:317-913(+)
MKITAVLLCCVIALVAFPTISHCSYRIKTLKPDLALSKEIVTPGSTIVYKLEQLQASSHYEVRISYPATSPTDFIIQLVTEDSETFDTGRDLLNTEKVMFQTDSKGKILGKFPSSPLSQTTLQPPYVIVTAKYAGVSYLPNMEKEEVVYDIVLETLLKGAPFDVIKIAVVVVLGLIFVVAVVIPQLLPKLPGFKRLFE